jgi:hypothetical protein
MTPTQSAKVIRLEVTPQQIQDCMPIGFLAENENAEDGFSDKPLGLKVGTLQEDIVYNVAYDGELELLAEVVKMPDDATDEDAEQAIGVLFTEKDEDEEE